MAGSRTLKLSILADVADLKNKLDDGNKEVQGFGDKLDGWASKAKVAFAAAGAAAAAYAGKLAIDGVKAAIEDEAAQVKLATTLKNVTGATQGQIKAVEDYITKTSLATGVADDQLRPALSRLTLSTKDVNESQKLLNLALDISASTGKDLTSVSDALAKAHDGNTKALKTLGIQTTESTTVTADNTKAKQAAERAQLAYNQAIDKYGIGSDQATKAALIYEQALDNAEKTTTKTSKSTKDFDTIVGELSTNFENQATKQAETFEGKMNRLKVAFDEGKETVGSFILDAITPLVTTLVNDIIPKISDFASEIGDNLQPVFEDLSSFFTETVLPVLNDFWDFLNKYIIPILNKTLVPLVKALFEAFKSVSEEITKNSDGFKALLKDAEPLIKFIKNTLAPAIGTILVTAVKAAGTVVETLVKGFNGVASAISDVIDGIKALIKLVADNPLVKGIGGVISKVFGGGKASGGSVNAGTTYLVGEQGAEYFTPAVAGVITPMNKVPSSGGTTNINITVNGAIDPEGVARQINNILTQSAARGGGASTLVFA